jgi:hypothetical protein
MVDPTNWWNYFKKTEQGNGASCMHCNWTMKRSKDKSTKGLVAEYITEPVILMKSDPFKYWSGKQNENKWKYLWPLVRKYLSAPCGSVESERLFSQAKYITTDLRKRISNENLKMLLFIHENLPLIGFEY